VQCRKVLSRQKSQESCISKDTLKSKVTQPWIPRPLKETIQTSQLSSIQGCTSDPCSARRPPPLYRGAQTSADTAASRLTKRKCTQGVPPFWDWGFWRVYALHASTTFWQQRITGEELLDCWVAEIAVCISSSKEEYVAMWMRTKDGEAGY
jgi:hypothetical protein